MSGNPASDEESDVEIEEVEVLNPLDLSVEEAFHGDNINESYEDNRGRDRDISIDSDEHYGDNQDNAIDQTGSGSDSDHLEIEDEVDEEDSVVIENPNDVVAYETDEEEPRPVTGFQEVFNQNLVNHGASTSNQVQTNPTKRMLRLSLERQAPANVKMSSSRLVQFNLTETPLEGPRFANRGEPQNMETSNNVSFDNLRVLSADPTVPHQQKRPATILHEPAVVKKSRQSEPLPVAADDPPAPAAASSKPVEPPGQAPLPTESPSYEDLVAEVARLKQDLSDSSAGKATLTNEYDSLVTKLQGKVECPVCFDVPKQAPVPVCPNGHVVCQGCKRDTCPTCRVRMGHGTSILAVTVIENIPHSCEFQIYGCLATCSIGSLPSHQATCQYRAVRCPNFNCVERVPLTLLAEHTLRRCIHNGTFYNTPLSNSYNYIIPANQTDQFDNRRNSTWRPDGITYDGKNFFLKITRKGKKAMWYFYVQMAGSEADAKQYTATIYVFRTSVGVDGKNSHRFIGDICPIDLVSTDRAAEAGYCCVLTDAQMKRVFTEGPAREADKKFGFSVEVRIESEETDISAPVGLDAEATNTNEVVVAPGPGSSNLIVVAASQEQEPSRRMRVARVRSSHSEQVDRDGFRIMRHQRPSSPLNLARRCAGPRAMTSSPPPPGTSGELAGPSMLMVVPGRSRKLPQAALPETSDSSSEEDLVPCPQCGREYQISGVVRHASTCQAGNRDQR
eukprot:TRINITY_DN24438_c0_g1_i1.p1 TRINITY_DN24438_c0_g1~~TRINITY_DN24438_c0_g1_i1.p1  ORF type:complete len:751 (+),score=260.97 TRINITY_DN24438_c0_g1_i1:58-2253(+)